MGIEFRIELGPIFSFILSLLGFKKCQSIKLVLKSTIVLHFLYDDVIHLILSCASYGVAKLLSHNSNRAVIMW